MKLEQLTQCMAATLASLFLILTLCAFGLGSHPSTGIRIPMMRLGAYSLDDCPDVTINVILRKNGDLHINQTAIAREALGSRIREIMSYRAERVVYLRPDSETSYVQVAAVLDNLANSTESLHIALISGEIRREEAKNPLVFCGLTWPKGEWNH